LVYDWFLVVVSAQLPGANGYTGGKVVFVDTENTLYPFIQWSLHSQATHEKLYVVSLASVFSRPDRLRDIADRFNLDQNAVLDNVLYARAYTSEHQYELLDLVAAKFHEEPGVFKLLVSPRMLWVHADPCDT